MALQFCVVCGRGSQRGSWPQSGSVNGIAYVACDFHSLASIVVSIADTGGVPANVQVWPAQTGKVRKSVHDNGGG